MFGIMLYDILFFAIPAVLILFFAISLYRYRSAKTQNEQQPGSFSPEEMKRRKLMLIIASVVAIILVAVVIGFIALLFMAVAFM